mgnify:FL=1
MDITEHLIVFFKEGPGKGLTVTVDTPLLEWGLLDSLKVVELAEFLKKHAAFQLKPKDLRKANLRDIRSIARLVGARRRAGARAKAGHGF